MNTKKLEHLQQVKTIQVIEIKQQNCIKGGVAACGNSYSGTLSFPKD